MRLVKNLLEKPADLPAPSSYTAFNGMIYLAAGALLIVWPAATQTIFMDRAFVGDEGGLVCAIGMAVAVIGWLYLFGGRSGARQIVAASGVRPINSRSTSARSSSHRGRVPSFASGVRDSRPDPRHRRLGAVQSHDLRRD